MNTTTQQPKSPTEMWGFIDDDIRQRITSNQDLANMIVNMDETERAKLKTAVYKKYTDKPEFQVQIGEEAYYETTPNAFGGMTHRKKKRPVTRKLESRETEQLWAGYKQASLPAEEQDVELLKHYRDIESLSDDERKNMLNLAKKEKSDLLPLFKYDSRYIESYNNAVQILADDARRGQLDPNSWKNTWAGEVARGVGSSFINPIAAIDSTIRRAVGGVEYGNPKKLSKEEIDDVALKDATWQLFPYLAGTKDFDDIRDNTSTARKVSRGIGDIASFLLPTPNKFLFTKGFKFAGNSMKDGLAKGLVKGAAGGTAVSPLYANNIPAPIQEYDVSDYAKDLGIEAVASAATGAVFDAGAYGLGKLFQQMTGKYNPFYKNIAQAGADDFAKLVKNINDAKKNGAIPVEAENFLKAVKEQAKVDKVNVDDVLNGKIGIEYFEQVLRPAIQKMPIIKDVLPNYRRFHKYKDTNVKDSTVKGEKFNADDFRAETDNALKKDYKENSLLLKENALPAVVENPANIAPSKKELAQARYDMGKRSYNPIPIYLEGTVESPQGSLFEDLPTNNDVLDRNIVPVQEVPVDMLKLSKDVPNFKENADVKTGIVAGNELSGRYIRLETAPIVVWQRLNGDLEKITGRHRAALAKAAGELTIPAQIIKESDGFTVEDAKKFDAESNIRDGNGTVRDYANYFRISKNMTEPEAIERGLIARQAGRKGWDIGRNGSDDLYTLYRNNKISEDKAASIAGNAPMNDVVQKVALSKAKTLNASELAMFTKNLDLRYRFDGNTALGDDSASQLDLFDSTSPWIVEMERISKVQAQLLKDNLEKITSVKSAVKRPQAAKKMGVDISNPDAIKDAIDSLLIENKRIANPDGAMLQKIRKLAGLSEIDSSLAGGHLNNNTTTSKKGSFGYPDMLNNAESEKAFLSKEPDIVISGDEIKNVNDIAINKEEILKYWNGKYQKNKISENKYSFNSKYLNDIIIDEKTVKSTISKKYNLHLNRKAFAVIGEVIENGIRLNPDENWKNRGYSSFILSTPVKISNENYIVSVVVNSKIAEKHRNGNVIYINNAYIVDTINIKDLQKKSLGVQTAPNTEPNLLGDRIANSPKPVLDTLIKVFQSQENNIGKSKKNKFASPEAIYGNKIDGEAYNRFDVNRFDDSPRLNYDEQKAQSAFEDLLDSVEKNQPMTENDLKVAKERVDLYHKLVNPRMLELPELLELTKIITKSDVSIKKEIGWALGYYTSGKKTITLRSELFKLITTAEEKKLEHSANVNALKKAGYHTKFLETLKPLEVASMVVKDKALKKASQDIYRKQYEQILETRKVNGHPLAGLAVLAHELGHAIDDMPNNAIGVRGNTLGRILSTFKEVRRTAHIFKDYEGISLTPALRQKIRREARKLAGKKPTSLTAVKQWNEKIKSFYKMLIDEHLEKNGQISLSQARKEMLDVVKYWQGIPEYGKVHRYFEKPSELYAENFSMLLNNPVKYQEIAPNVYKTLLANLKTKEVFWRNWTEFQHKINNPELLVKERQQRLNNSWVYAKMNRTNLERFNKVDKTPTIDKLSTIVNSEFSPIYRRAKKIAKRTGKDWYEITAPIHDYRYRGSFQEAYAHRFNKLLKMLDDSKLSSKELSTFQFYRRVINERHSIANPFGFTPKQALDGLKGLQRTLDPVQWQKLHEVETSLREIRSKYIIEPLVELGAFSEELNQKLLTNKFYTPFNKATNDLPASNLAALLKKRYGANVGSQIHTQFGNLGEIDEPLGALLTKDLAIISFVHKQKAIRNVIDILKKESPEWIIEADVEKSPDGYDRPVIYKQNGVDTLIVLENGQSYGYYVSDYIAEPFTFTEMNLPTKCAAMVNRVVKDMLVQKVPPVWIGLHIKDIQHAARALPGKGILSTWIALTQQSLKAFKAARSIAKNNPNQLAVSALDRGFLISRRNANAVGNDLDDYSDATRTLREFAIKSAEIIDERQNILSKLNIIMDQYSQILERIMKIASMEYIDKNYPDMPEYEKLEWVRTCGGSPDFLNRINQNAAPWIDLSVQMFANPIRQGWDSESVQIRRKGWKKWLAGLTIASSIGAILTIIAKSTILEQIFGDDTARDMRKMWYRIPEWDRINRICIPLFSLNDETIYISLPQTDIERQASALMMSALDGEVASGSFRTIYNEYGDGNPIFDIPWKGLQILNDENPKDFKGAYVIDQTKFDAGYVKGDFATYVYNQTAGSLLGRIDKEPKLGSAEPHPFKQFLNLPLVKSTLGRYIKSSKAGLYNVAAEPTRELKKEQARERLEKQGIAFRIFNKSETPKDMQRLNEMITSPAERSAFIKILRTADTREDTFYDVIFNSATSKEDSYRRIKRFEEFGVIGQSEANKYLEILYRKR